MNAISGLLKKLQPLLVVLKLSGWHRHAHGEYVIGSESRLNFTQMLKTLDQESRTYQQYEGHRDLGDHYEATQTTAASGAGAAAQTFL